MIPKPKPRPRQAVVDCAAERGRGCADANRQSTLHQEVAEGDAKAGKTDTAAEVEA
ncbi:MAG: hypothetical protein V9E81_17210 [Marmoricola sp.]